MPQQNLKVSPGRIQSWNFQVRRPCGHAPGRSHHINDECSNSACGREPSELGKAQCSGQGLSGISVVSFVELWAPITADVSTEAVCSHKERKQKSWVPPGVEATFIKPSQTPSHSCLEFHCKVAVLSPTSLNLNLNLGFHLFLVFVSEKEKVKK